jgi:hypothetical protein
VLVPTPPAAPLACTSASAAARPDTISARRPHPLPARYPPPSNPPAPPRPPPAPRRYDTRILEHMGALAAEPTAPAHYSFAWFVFERLEAEGAVKDLLGLPHKFRQQLGEFLRQKPRLLWMLQVGGRRARRAGRAGRGGAVGLRAAPEGRAARQAADEAPSRPGPQALGPARCKREPGPTAPPRPARRRSSRTSWTPPPARCWPAGRRPPGAASGAS